MDQPINLAIGLMNSFAKLITRNSNNFIDIKYSGKLWKMFLLKTCKLDKIYYNFNKTNHRQLFDLIAILERIYRTNDCHKTTNIRIFPKFLSNAVNE